MSQKNIGVVQDGYAAFGRGDIPGLLALLDDNVEWKTPGMADLPTAGTRSGRAAVADFFRVVNELFVFESFEPQSFLADGDRVVVAGTNRYTVKGGSGTSLTEEWCHIFTIKDGRIVSFQEYLDTAPFAAELKATAARV